MGIKFGGKGKESDEHEKDKRYVLKLLLNNEEVTTLLDTLEYADTSAYTKGNLVLSGRLHFLLRYVKREWERAKEFV